MKVVVILTTLALLVGCGSEDGDFGKDSQVELTLEGVGTVALVCPTPEPQPLDGQGRECYIRGEADE